MPQPHRLKFWIVGVTSTLAVSALALGLPLQDALAGRTSSVRDQATGTPPPIRLSASNQVPACVTPAGLMGFLIQRNPGLDPRYRDIAQAYKALGESWGVRWDYAFYQMVIETNFLKYRRDDGNAGDVRARQNNFAGIGTTGGGVPGDAYASIDMGVLAQMQHLVVYSGERIEKPIAPRTQLTQDDILDKSRRLNRPVTFGDLAGRWAADKRYGHSIEFIAGLYRASYCTGATVAHEADRPSPAPAPLQNIGVKPAKIAAPAAAAPAAAPAVPATAPRRATVEKLLVPSPKPAVRPASVTNASLPEASLSAGPAPDAVPAPAVVVASTAKQNEPAPTSTPPPPQSPPQRNFAARLPLPTLSDVAPPALPEPNVAAAAPTTATAPTSAVPGPAVPPQVPTKSQAQVAPEPRVAGAPCQVLTASYGGARTLLIRALTPEAVRYTALQVQEGFERSMAERYIKAAAPFTGELMSSHESRAAALEAAYRLCPSARIARN